MPHQIVPFLIITAVLTLTPGPDMALVLRNGIAGGRRAAWWTGLGCCAGIAIYAAASAVGLAAVLAASATAFLVIKLAGAAYLVYLGVMALWHARHTPRPTPVQEQTPSAPVSRRLSFRQGLLSNLLNPKIALIFLTLIPQFVSPDEPALTTTATLASVFLLVAVVWWRLFSLTVGALGGAMSRPRVRTTLERITGVVLIGLGIRVALTRA